MQQENFQFQTPLTPYNYLQQQSNKSNIQCTLNTLCNISSLPQQSLTSPLNNQQRSNITVTHNYPNNKQIHVLRTLSNRTTTYIYNVLFLGFYPKIPKTTKRTTKDGPVYAIPDNYTVLLCIHDTEVICSTKYQFDGSVKFTVTWDKSNSQKESVYSLKSASDVGHLFLKVIIFSWKC